MMMMHMSSSDCSDTLSQDLSSPRGSAVYFVQSPSETDKSSTDSNQLSMSSPPSVQSSSYQSSSQQLSQTLGSRSESGSWLMGWRNSLTSIERPSLSSPRSSSSSSLISSTEGRIFRSGKQHSERSRRWKLDYWQAIDEEGKRKRFPGYSHDDGDYEKGGYMWWRYQVWLLMLAFGVVFGSFCFVLWGATRPYEPQILLKGLTVKNFFTGEGSDMTGVPTKVLTVDSSLVMRVHNPATFYGIHVSATSVNLLYYDLVLAAGKMKGYYQPRSSWRNLNVSIRADKVPLYGAGLGFAAQNGKIPFNLEMKFSTKGHVLGKLVTTHNKLRVNCPINIDPIEATMSVHFSLRSCTYDRLTG